MNRSRLCASLLNDVMEVKTKSVSSYESLYRKIVSYLLVKSHVGNPTSLQVIKESTGGPITF